MKLSSRERRTLTAGAVVAVLTVLVTWVWLPLRGKWTALGDELEPKLLALDVLRERAGQWKTLAARRTRLVRQVGTLLKEEPPPKKKEKKKEAEEGPPEKRTDAAKPAEEGPGASKPVDSAVASAEAAPAAETTVAEADTAVAEGPPDRKPARRRPRADAPPNKDDKPEPDKESKPEKKKEPERTAIEAELEKTIKKCGGRIKLMSAKTAPQAQLAYFKPVMLQVDMDAKIDALVKTLHALEKGPRFIRVDSLTINQDAKKPGAMSVSMDLVAYERAEPEGGETP